MMQSRKKCTKAKRRGVIKDEVLEEILILEET